MFAGSASGPEIKFFLREDGLGNHGVNAQRLIDYLTYFKVDGGAGNR